MSDLATFRDHCRRMGGPIPRANIHLTADERALFRRLASEVDRYLDGDPAVVSRPEPDDQPLTLEA